MSFVYVLSSERYDRIYIGCTCDVERRLAEHNSGKSRSTKAYRPWKLYGCRSFETLSEARKYESYLKTLKNPRIVKKYIIVGS